METPWLISSGECGNDTHRPEPRRVPKGGPGHGQGIRVAGQPGALHPAQAADDHVRQGAPEAGHGEDP